MSLEGVIIVALRETYQNSIEKELEKIKEEDYQIIERDIEKPYIDGPIEINPYDIVEYQIKKLPQEDLIGE